MVLKYYHEFPISSHMFIAKTLAHITKYIWVKDLKDQITQRVKTCVQCQRAKQAQNTIAYQASDIPTVPFQKLFID